MKIQLVSLNANSMSDIPVWSHPPYSCKYCFYWELPSANKDMEDNRASKMMAKKLAWLQHVQTNFGDCGIMLYVNEKAIAYAEYAPVRFLPNTINYPIPPTPDAVIIACLFVFDAAYRGQGFGTVLLNAVIENLENRGVRAIEAIARKSSANNPAGPFELYLKNGFTIYKDDPEFPLMRLEL